VGLASEVGAVVKPVDVVPPGMVVDAASTTTVPVMDLWLGLSQWMCTCPEC
jgi:hypothetical protein